MTRVRFGDIVPVTGFRNRLQGQTVIHFPGDKVVLERSPVSISDVAARAGVSRATVSRVLNGRKTEQIAADTRRRVEAVVAELGYFPNAMARGLARSRTNSIGLVFLHSHQPLHANESFVMMMDGILEKATYARKDTLICTSYSWSDGRANFSALLDRRCDGLILVVPRTDNQAVPMLKEYGIPFVQLAGYSEDPTVSFVDTDNETAAAALIGHLITQGHRRIAVLWSPDDVHLTFATGRLAGYKQALEQHGIPLNPALVVDAVYLEENLRQMMALPAANRPTALFGIHDNQALWAMCLLQKHGWRIPQDISVVGYDDIPSAARATPGLTTVRQPLKRMGGRCVEILLELIEEKNPAGVKEVMPFELVIRPSAAPPPP